MYVAYLCVFLWCSIFLSWQKPKTDKIIWMLVRGKNGWTTCNTLIFWDILCTFSRNVDSFNWWFWFIAERGKWNCVVACKIPQFVSSVGWQRHSCMRIYTHFCADDRTGLDKVCKDYTQICLQRWKKGLRKLSFSLYGFMIFICYIMVVILYKNLKAKMGFHRWKPTDHFSR